MSSVKRLCAGVLVLAMMASTVSFVSSPQKARAANTPTLVQHSLWQSNENYETGNTFKLKLPNPVLAGNLVILALTYAYSAGRTVNITDDNGGNTWTAGPVTNDTGNGLTSKIYYSMNTAAGTKLITVTFDAALEGFQANASEFYNVATSNAADGSSSANTVLTTGPIASGAFSTAVDGDLIYQFGGNSSFGTQLSGDSGNITSMTAGSGMTLLSADRQEGAVNQYKIQSVHGSTNPDFTVSDGGGGSYNSLTIAFKAAAAGTAPSASGIRIVTVFHTRISNTGTNSHTIEFPTTGNLFVLSTAYHEGQETLNTASSSPNVPWTVVTGSGMPQFAYLKNATPSSTMKLTVNLTDLGSGNLQMLLYDIVNADTTATPTVAYASGGAFGPGNVADAPDITPTTANGLVIAALNLYTGPPDSMSSPSGVIFDSIYFTGYTDLSPADSGDGYSHYYNPDTSALNFTWHNTMNTSGWSAAAIAFKAAPVSSGGGTGRSIKLFQAVHLKIYRGKTKILNKR